MTKRINRLVLQAIAATLIAASFNSCSDKNEDGVWATFETKNVTDVFFKPKKFFAHTYNSLYFAISCSNDLTLGEEPLPDDIEDIYPHDSRDPNLRKMFSKYAEYYGDTVTTRMHAIASQYHACVSPLLSIEIITDKKIDEKHPEGSNINDLFELRQYQSGMYEYLNLKTEEGLPIYKTTDFDTFYRNYYYIGEHNHYELNSVPFYMVSDLLYFQFKQLPDVKGEFKFTVSLKFADDPITGEKIEVEPVTVEMTF